MRLARPALIIAGALTIAVCAREPELVLLQRDAEARPSHSKKHHAQHAEHASRSKEGGHKKHHEWHHSHQVSLTRSKQMPVSMPADVVPSASTPTVAPEQVASQVTAAITAAESLPPPAVPEVAAPQVSPAAVATATVAPSGAMTVAAAAAAATAAPAGVATAVSVAAATAAPAAVAPTGSAATVTASAPAMASAAPAVAGSIPEAGTPTLTAVPEKAAAAPSEPSGTQGTAASTSAAATMATLSPAQAGEAPSGVVPPVGAPAPQLFQCASETSLDEEPCLECTMSSSCACEGYIRFGYSPSWTEWMPASGVMECAASTFGGQDPEPGHGKVCVCYGHPSDVPVALATPLSGVGLPILIVAGVAVAVSIALTMAHGFNTINDLPPGPCELALQAGTPAVHIAPMICAMFVAVAMRAESLTPAKGSFLQTGRSQVSRHVHLGLEPLEAGQDPLSGFPGMNFAVTLVAAAFVIQVMLRLYAEHLIVQVELGQHAGVQQHRQMVKFWSRIHHVAILVMNGGIVAIILGILTMRTSSGGVDGMFLASIACSVALAIVYFTAYGALHILVTIPKPFGAAVMKLSALNMNFAPMICIMFLGLQVSADSAGRDVPRTVEDNMFLCVGAVLCQVTLGVVTPFIFGAELQRVGPKGEEDLVIRSQDGVVATSLLRWAVMAVLYYCVWEVCQAMWVLNAEPPRERLLCFLAAVYFAMYLFLWVALTARQLAQGGFQNIIRVLAEGKEMVAFCPMMAALVLAWWVY